MNSLEYSVVFDYKFYPGVDIDESMKNSLQEAFVQVYNAVCNETHKLIDGWNKEWENCHGCDFSDDPDGHYMKFMVRKHNEVLHDVISGTVYNEMSNIHWEYDKELKLHMYIKHEDTRLLDMTFHLIITFD